MKNYVRTVLAVLAIANSACSVLCADWKDEIGYTSPQVGQSVADGSRVEVAQIEWEVGGIWAPFAVGELAFVQFVDVGDWSYPATSMSSHAYEVGQYFYGVDSMLPMMRKVYRGETVDYYYFTLGALAVSPPGHPPLTTLPWSVENHSYSGTFASPSDPTYIRTMDMHLRNDNVVGVFSADNTTGGLYPLHTSVNGLLVGSATGNHRTGFTYGFYHGGRTKPDIVGTADYTSFTAPMVAGSAGLLIDEARRRASVMNGGDDARVVKALLLTGADTAPFPAWHNTESRPLDPTFGAGRVHIGNSMRVLQERERFAVDPIIRTDGRDGHSCVSNFWHRGVTANGSTWYHFAVGVDAEDRDMQFAATLAWFNKAHATIPNSTVLDNLDLVLWEIDDYQGSAPRVIARSISSVDSVEHIRAVLQRGEYALEVVSAVAGELFGIAAFTPNDLKRPYIPAVPLVIESFTGTPAINGSNIYAMPNTQITLTVVATGGPGIEYQWKKFGINLVGETGPVLSFMMTQASGPGSYSVSVTDGPQQATREVWVRMGIPPPVQPTF